MTNANVMRLRSSWKTRLQHKDLCPEWQDFNAFLSWAEENGYGEGKGIRKFNNDLPASPRNCYIFNCYGTVQETDKQKQYRLTEEKVTQWDKTVAMFRRNLEKASLIQEATLIHRIRSGLMPREWYPPKS